MVRRPDRVLARAGLLSASPRRAASQSRAGRAARGDRAVHQPGLLVLPARRQADRRNMRTIPRVIALSLRGRLLGLSRLEGHAGAARPLQPPARLCQGARRPPGLHAAGGGQWRGARARQRQGRDRARDPADARAELAAARCRSSIEQTGDKLTVTVPAAKDEKGQAEVWLCPITKIGSGRRSAAARTAATPSPTPTWCGAGSSSAIGPARPRPSTCRSRTCRPAAIDSAAVVVQSGVASAPKLMLGAAQIACCGRRQRRRR